MAATQQNRGSQQLLVETTYDDTVTKAGTKNMIEEGNEDESIHDYDDDEYIYCEDYCNYKKHSDKRDALITTT